MRTLIVVVIIAVVFFAFPLLNNVPIPDSFAPEAIGGFISTALNYWKDLFNSIA